MLGHIGFVQFFRKGDKPLCSTHAIVAAVRGEMIYNRAYNHSRTPACVDCGRDAELEAQRPHNRRENIGSD